MKKRILSVLIATAMLVSASATAVFSKTAAEYSDIKPEAWYFEYVEYALDYGIMEGKSADVFAPLEQVTRAQLVTIFARLANADTEGMGQQLSFPDTKTDAWYADSMAWAVSEGLINGYDDGTCRPNAFVLRQEYAVIFARYMAGWYVSLPTSPLTDGFSDGESIPSWASEAVEEVRRCGIFGGADGKFEPKKGMSRAELATAITRYLKAYPDRVDEMHLRFAATEALAAAEDGFVHLTFGSASSLTQDMFGEGFLPLIGLDASEYTIVADDAAFEAMIDSFKDTDYETEGIFFLSFSVKNRSTGELTDKARVKFKLTKVDIPVYVDPDTIDPGFPEGVYEQMLATSLYSTGDISRLAAALERAEAGEGLSACYIGGSITEGASAGSWKCWARVTQNYFDKYYAGASPIYANAGLSGTPSILGNIRLERDVLAYDPDIVFVEFAVNDYVGEPCEVAFESMIRSILNYESSPAVVIVLSAGAGGADTGTRPFMKRLAEYYDLPVVDVNNALHEQISAGVLTYEGFCSDGVHPDDMGHSVMGGMMINLVKTVETMANAADPEDMVIKDVPADSLTGAYFEGMSFREAGCAEAVSLGSWATGRSNNPYLSDGWTRLPSGGSEAMTIEFTGRNLYAVFNETYEDSVTLEIRIDGGEAIEVVIDGLSYPLILSGKASERHTVEIAVSEKDAAKRVEFLGFAYN